MITKSCVIFHIKLLLLNDQLEQFYMKLHCFTYNETLLYQMMKGKIKISITIKIIVNYIIFINNSLMK